MDAWKTMWWMVRLLGYCGAGQVLSGVGNAALAASSPLAFRDVTAASGISYSGPSWSIAWADVNGDSFPDLFLGNHGNPHNLFFGDGTGRFTEARAGTLERPFADAHGAAWADFDADGDQDLVELVGAATGTVTKANRLFVNEGGVFRDRAVALGVHDPLGRGRWPLWFDWNQDGLLDLLVMNAPRADGPSVLFRNQGGAFGRTQAIGSFGATKFALLGSFRADKRHLLISGWPFPLRVFDANQLSPLPLTDLRSSLRMPVLKTQVTDAALFDVNGDGLDDLFEIKGVLTSDAMVSGGQLMSRLQLDKGGTRGFNFAASGTIEVMIAPRGGAWWSPVHVFIGSGGVHPRYIPFELSPTDPGVEGLATPSGSKGIYVGYDRAAKKWQLRMVATAYQEGNVVVTASGLGGLETVGFARFAPSSRPTLMLSGGGVYRNVSESAGLTASAASNCFSAAAADFDNDGDVDVFAACSGSLAKQGVENQVFRNSGNGSFTLVPDAAGVARRESGVADGVAAADFDVDGFVDLVLTNGQGAWPFDVGPTQVFRNTSGAAGNANHWLQVDLVGVRSNPDAVGARVVVTAGGRRHSRMQRNGMHNGGQDHSRIHFGLGSSVRVESLEIFWPSGARQVLRDVAADRVIRVVES